MRLAVLLLLALPAYAVAQPSPPASVLKLPHPLPPPVAPHQATTEHKPAPSKPGEHNPAKPADHKPAAKPTDHKPAPKPVRKPAPPPHPAPVAPAPAPAPAAEPAPPAEPGKGSNTGMPLPRYAALRSDEVNFRSGPGSRYPIDWVYKRRDLPVVIEREFDIWRLVQDPFGSKGWVNRATLTERRTAIVTGSERVLHQAASDTAGPVAKLKPGVILRLRTCEANSEWCQAQIGDYRGYIKRSEIWGVLPGEVIQ